MHGVPSIFHEPNRCEHESGKVTTEIQTERVGDSIGEGGPSHNLQATALVHEAYLMLVGPRELPHYLKPSRTDFLFSYRAQKFQFCSHDFFVRGVLVVLRFNVSPSTDPNLSYGKMNEIAQLFSRTCDAT